MADPFSLAAGITQLMPLVKESFALIRDVFVSDRTLRSYLGRVELQQMIFEAWEGGWMDSHGRLEKKLEDFAVIKPWLAAKILEQLISVLKSLTEPEKLQKRYGLSAQHSLLNRHGDLTADLKYAASYLYDLDGRRFSRKDLIMLTENQPRHIGFLKKVRFVSVTAKPQPEEIVARLDEFNCSIQLYTADDTRNRRVFELTVKDVKTDPDRTRRLAEAAALEAKHSVDPGAKAEFDRWSKFANFSLAVQSASPGAMSRKKIFSRNEFSFDSPYKIGPHSTLARLLDYPTKYQSRLVLVEWVTISKSVMATFDGMKAAWYVLHAEKPETLCLPDSIGLIYDEADAYTIGYVFQLPAHIRSNLPTKPVGTRAGDIGYRVVRSPSTIAAQRKPTSLRQLIKKESRGLDLGVRFSIAKRVLDALHLMHAAEYIHKNIRPDNILFFPSPTRNGEDPDPTVLDYANPLLVGFHNASLEVEISAETPKLVDGLKPILKNRNPARIIALDCYQHPDRRTDPNAFYHRQYDLYSVGCVLLEIGLWDTLDSLSGQDIAARACHPSVRPTKEDVWKDAETVRKAAKGLDVITGSVYADVTRRCLSLIPISGNIVELERELAGALSQCSA
ncbi:hypothetical protein MFIFM68171_09829 [Madurella fahalii]|uniref:Protein kinase domain-containing protein n=1 Tax=Madurella fahalii TaxID=1157608 RepID=A0ABQ0GPF2_9PEZI